VKNDSGYGYRAKTLASTLTSSSGGSWLSASQISASTNRSTARMSRLIAVAARPTDSAARRSARTRSLCTQPCTDR
jgi:hypothetical protein